MGAFWIRVGLSSFMLFVISIMIWIPAKKNRVLANIIVITFWLSILAGIVSVIGEIWSAGR